VSVNVGGVKAQTGAVIMPASAIAAVILIVFFMSFICELFPVTDNLFSDD